jgi:alkanesulfonate monooxygenase SsuD/methylene tetrahydromethanopterin reductase-like flavin-dependent oxidoreductase (luciferase family)
MGAAGPVPIFLATLTPKSLELTGALADGWLASSFMPEHAAVFTDHLRAGAERAGRKLEDLELQAGGVVAFGDDLERLLDPRRPGLAFELGAMGSREHNYYNEAYQRAGFREVALEVQRLWLDGKRDAARRAVPDEIILTTNLLGTDAMVADRIRAYRAAGVTTISVEPAGETLSERVETLGRFMHLLAEVNAGSQPPSDAGRS